MSLVYHLFIPLIISEQVSANFRSPLLPTPSQPASLHHYIGLHKSSYRTILSLPGVSKESKEESDASHQVLYTISVQCYTHCARLNPHLRRNLTNLITIYPLPTIHDHSYQKPAADELFSDHFSASCSLSLLKPQLCIEEVSIRPKSINLPNFLDDLAASELCTNPLENLETLFDSCNTTRPPSMNTMPNLEQNL